MRRDKNKVSLMKLHDYPNLTYFVQYAFPELYKDAPQKNGDRRLLVLARDHNVNGRILKTGLTVGYNKKDVFTPINDLAFAFYFDEYLSFEIDIR